MIDREQLEATYRRMRQVCLGLLVSPAMLTLVAWSVSAQAAISGGPGSGDAPLPWLLGLGAFALSPLLAVPLALALLRRAYDQPARPDAANRLQALIGLESYVACCLWEITTLAAFVAFFMGGPWWFLLGGVAITYTGLAVSFPRWSRWLRRADELGGMAGEHSIPAPL
ncbi:MAG: hypothetical protein ABFC80_10085 [Coriobacteriales bacterium]|nr:hypothetical protein [Actinomycetes bacterium]